MLPSTLPDFDITRPPSSEKIQAIKDFSLSVSNKKKRREAALFALAILSIIGLYLSVFIGNYIPGSVFAKYLFFTSITLIFSPFVSLFYETKDEAALRTRYGSIEEAFKDVTFDDFSGKFSSLLSIASKSNPIKSYLSAISGRNLVLWELNQLLSYSKRVERENLTRYVEASLS